MKKAIGILLVFVLLSAVGISAFGSQDQVPRPELRKELVKLKYIRARQVHQLLVGYQSEYGRLRVEDELNIITIQETPEIVDKMLSVIQEIDVKPVDILFTVELIVGAFKEEKEEVIGVRASDKGLESDPLMKEMQRVGLEHLPVVHQAPHLFCGRCQVFAAHDPVHRLGRAQMMADRANPAQPLHSNGHFPVGPSLNESLKAAKLHYMHSCLVDLALVIKPDGDLGMTFDSRNRIDDDLFSL